MSFFARCSVFVCVLLLVLTDVSDSSSSSALAEEPLNWKFVPNETFNYRLTQHIQMTMDLAEGGTLQVLVDQTLDLLLQVEKTMDDGSSLLRLKIQQVQLDIDGPGGQGLHYDSSAEGRPQGFAAMLADLLKAFTTESYQVTLSPRGKVIRVDVPEALLEAISNAPGSALMAGFATQEGFQAMLQSCLLVLPENGPLQPNDEWTVTVEAPNPALGGKPRRSTTYHYVGPQTAGEQSLEKFTRQAVTEFDLDANPEGTTLEVIEQQSSGEALFLRSAGRLESSTDKQTMTLRITVGKQSVRQTLKQTVKCQWVDKEK